jgi:hypothetical protein
MDNFADKITLPKELSEAFTVEVEEKAAVMEENGLDEQEAFRKAVRFTTDEWLSKGVE